MFRDFDSGKTKGNSFNKDKEFGDHFSYVAYNNNLMRLIEFYGQTPFDWYRNKITGEIIWLEGHAKIDHYSNLGHTWGKTFANGDRLLLDGDTGLITYNGEVVYDFNKKSSNWGSGIAFSDGGNNQDPSSLRRGSRNIKWIDFGGAFEALIAILGFEVKGKTSKGKGTNGGKPTIENKIDDGINAVDNGSNATKAANETVEKQKAKENDENSSKANKNLRTTWYDKNGKETRTEIRPKKSNE